MGGVSINELTTYRWAFEKDILRYAALGVSAVGVWRQKLADFGDEKGVELLRDTGMSVSNLLWAGGFTGSDGHSYREAIEDASEAIDLAAELGTNCLVVYSGGRGGHTHGHSRRLLLGALQELVPQARQRGVYLALEPMHESCAQDWTFLTTVDDTLDVIDAADDSAGGVLRLVLDTYHLGQDRQLLGRLEELVPRTAVVHVGDTKRTALGEQNRCRLGEGRVPLAEILAGLTEAGYDGYFDVELIGEDVETTDYEQLIIESKAVCEHLLHAACA